MRAIYDVDRQQFLDLANMPGGVVGFISWAQLAAMLKANGERATHLKIDDDGITFRVEKV